MTYPILLAHGISRFDVVGRALLDAAADDRGQYFRGIRSTLEASGFRVHDSTVPWAEGVTTRAAVLKENVEEVLRAERCAKVHIIAHCMGGLDARHMLFDHRADRMHEKVAAIATIGTPHHGTTFADWGITSGTAALALIAGIGVTSLEGLGDLTTWACAEFDRKAERFERECGVAFLAFAGTQQLPFVFDPLKPAWVLIHANEGPNDGFVSVESARWRDEYFAGEVSADHLNEVGWWDPNDLGRRLFSPGARWESRNEMETRIRAFYLGIATELARRFPHAS
jgi:triacylglycerol lipase